MSKKLSKKQVENCLNWLKTIAQCIAEVMVRGGLIKDGEDFRARIELERFGSIVFRDLYNENPFELHKAIERELNKLTKAKYEVSAISTLHSDWSEIYADAEVIKEK